MHVWLRDKLQNVTKEFLDGASFGTVFEAVYLAYLECLVAHWRGVPAAREVWEGWHKVCEERTPPGEKVSCLSTWVTDRQELVDALQAYQRRFEGPTPRRFKLPKEAQPEPEKRSDDGEFGLLDLLTGE